MSNWTDDTVSQLWDDLKAKYGRNFIYDEPKDLDAGNGWLFNFVDSHGGYEGEGEEHWVIFALTDSYETQYYKINGYYASHDGRYLDGSPYRVYPKQKTITVYE